MIKLCPEACERQHCSKTGWSFAAHITPWFPLAVCLPASFFCSFGPPAKAALARCARPAVLAARSALRVPREDVGDRAGQALRIIDVQELVRTVRVRMRPEYAGHQKLRARKALPEHGHERNRAPDSHRHAFVAEVLPRCLRDGVLEPGL